MGKERFETLDGMRGIAAIIVMLHHYFYYKHLPYLHNAFIAVDFFFILSGFVIMHSYADRLAGGMTAMRYVGRRILRLYPMMAISLVLGAPLFLLFTKLGHTDFFAREILASLVNNLFFLPYTNDRTIMGITDNALGTVFPINVPLWSIFFELIANLCFIFLYRLGRIGLLKLCLFFLGWNIAACLLLAFANYDPSLAVGGGWGTHNLMSGLPRVLYGFTCGMLLYKERAMLGSRFFGAQHFSSNPASLALYLLLAIVLVCPVIAHGLYYVVAIAVLAPLLVMWGGEIEPASRLVSKASSRLSWLSYPVYCLHMPVLAAAMVLDEKLGVKLHTGVSPHLVAIIGTLVLAVVLGQVEQWLRAILKNPVDRLFQPRSIIYEQPRIGKTALGFADEEQPALDTNG